MTAEQDKPVLRFSFAKVFTVLLIIKIATHLLRSVIYKLQEPHISWTEAFSNWTVYTFLFPFILTVAVYFFSINFIYKAYQKASLLGQAQAISVVFVLFFIYIVIVWRFDPESTMPQQVSPSVVLAILLGSIVDTAIVLVIAYLFHLRDGRKK